ncbi:MAG: hypothetical protein GY816_03350 [Cytophagales bacterium]|nr:hypothetical protein [Cytophagales bacterium]
MDCLLGMKFIALCLVLISFSCFGQEEIDSVAVSKRNRSQKKTERANRRIARKLEKKDTSDIISQPLRLEIPVEDWDDEFEVVKGYEEALLIIQNTNEIEKGGVVWKFHLVNKDLVQDWSVEEKIPSSDELIGYDYNAGFFFLLFENERKYLEYNLVVIDLEGKQTMNQKFTLPFEVEMKYLEALDKGILLVGNHNFRPIAMIYEIESRKPIVLPGFYNRNEKVFDLVMDDYNHAFSIVLKERMRNGKYTNRIKSFTFSGLLIQESIINPGEIFNLVDGKTTNLGNGVQYMAGTYSMKSSLFTRGIYVSKFVNGTQRFLKNYNYADLSNFFAYRGERVEARIQRRIGKKKEKGKMPKFDYRLYVHDIVQKGDVNILIAEAYIAKYGGSSSGFSTSPSGFNSNPYSGMPGQRVFVGYKFTHAVVMAFGSRGELLWDNSFKTNDITSFNLEESVAVNVQDDRAVIMYLDDNLIKSKVVEEGKVVEGKTYNPVKLLYSGDELSGRNSKTNGIESWYDNYLYSYGIRRIENKEFSKSYELRKRRVFYLNKIQFDSAPAEINSLRISRNK